MKKIVYTDNAPKAVGPYSQAVMMGDFMFCSGQISIDPKTNEVYIDDITKQTEMVITADHQYSKSDGLNCQTCSLFPEHVDWRFPKTERDT